MKIFEWLVLAITIRLFGSNPKQTSLVSSSSDKTETIEIFRLGTHEYQIFCAAVAKNIADDLDFRKRVFWSLISWLAGLITLGLAVIGITADSVITSSVARSEKRVEEVFSTLDRDVKKRISDSFAEPVIQKIVKDAAAGEAKSLLKNSVDPEIAKFNQRVAEFIAHMAEKEKKAAVNFEEFARQLETLKERNRITRLADSAIADGSLEAFEELAELGIRDRLKPSDGLTLAAEAEYIRALSAYVTVIERKPMIEITASKIDPKLTSLDQLTFDQLVILIKEQTNGHVRFKLSSLLRDKINPRSFDHLAAIMALMARENHLDALRELQAGLFRVIPVRFLFPGKRESLEWWKNNRAQLEQKFQKGELHFDTR